MTNSKQVQVDTSKKLRERELQYLKEWRKATHKLAQCFVDRYFPDYQHFLSGDWRFIGDDENGTLDVGGNWYFNISRIVEALELDATLDQLIDYYDWELELAAQDKKPRYNFKNYVKNTNLIYKKEKNKR